MSYARSPRGSRSSSKGESGQKKLKKRKQEFHTRRQHQEASQESDLEEQRKRTMIALEHLGRQQLSAEPGGYGFQNWIRSLNLLLDDFQDKVGASSLSPEYFRMRGEVRAGLLDAPDTRDVDDQIAALQAAAEAEKKVAQDVKRSMDVEASAMKAERARMSAELENLRRLRGELQRTKGKSSLLGRVFGRSRSASGPVDGQVREADSEMRRLESQLAALDASGKKSATSVPTMSQPDGRTNSALEEGEARLAVLGAERESRLQLAERRRKIAAEFSEIISRISLGTKEGGSAADGIATGGLAGSPDPIS